MANRIPFDVAAIGSGVLAVGYARTPTEAAGLEIDAAKAAVKASFSQRTESNIARVFPAPGRDEKFVITLEDHGPLRSAVHLAAPAPLVVGLAEGAVAAAERPDAQATPLWPVTGDEELEALRVTAAGERGYALVFRREKVIWGGWVGPARAPIGQLTKIVGSGGPVGKPSIGWNGREIAVVFADRPTEGGRWEIRAGHARADEIPAATVVIPLPEGGPGGDAFAPDIAGLPDGRWLLVWTEGPPGSRAMRAQTLAPDFTPAGDPIALSPPAGNFGQGLLGVAGSYVGAVFLSKPAATYELWGVVLQCG